MAIQTHLRKFSKHSGHQTKVKQTISVLDQQKRRETSATEGTEPCELTQKTDDLLDYYRVNSDLLPFAD